MTKARAITMRLQAAPQKGGDERLQWYVKAQNALGWLQGVYSNYADFATVNTNWNPDHVQRQPDGEWRRAWPRNYALKPAKAVEMDEYYAQRIKEKFGTSMSYTDVHTAVGPWKYCDYDARVPGAGTFAATFYAYGQLLLNDQRVYGPTQSEATYQWLYAGLESGSYGWVYTDVNLLTHPPDVAFRLHEESIRSSATTAWVHGLLPRERSTRNGDKSPAAPRVFGPVPRHHHRLRQHGLAGDGVRPKTLSAWRRWRVPIT